MNRKQSFFLLLLCTFFLINAASAKHSYQSKNDEQITRTETTECNTFFFEDTSIAMQELMPLNEWKKHVIEEIKNDPIYPSQPLFKKAIETISCNDCDNIPKVLNAGEIVVENGIEYQVMHNGLKIKKEYCAYASLIHFYFFMRNVYFTPGFAHSNI